MEEGVVQHTTVCGVKAQGRYDNDATRRAAASYWSYSGVSGIIFVQDHYLTPWCSLHTDKCGRAPQANVQAAATAAAG